MRMTPFISEVLRGRRNRRDLMKQGFRELPDVDLGISRISGGNSHARITEARVTDDGRSVFVKIEVIEKTQ